MDTDGLFAEANLLYGEDWVPLDDDGKNASFQTHTSYADEERYHVFAHPFDFHFKVNGPQGWPRLQVKLWRLDSSGRQDNIAYGIVTLPNKPGYHAIEMHCWRPMSTWQEEAYNFFLGAPSKMYDGNIVTKNVDQRKYLTTIASGTINIHCECLLKNFDA